MASIKGALFLVGGAADTVYADFVRLAGGPSAHIVIVPHASEVPEQRRDEISTGLKACGVTRITTIMPDDEVQDLPADVDAIFLGGGGQDRLVRLLDASGLGQQIRDANRRGLLVGGTSAGAAAASHVMVAGSPEDWTPEALSVSSVFTSKGLCLLPNVVFDTHFGNRNRQNRLRCVLGMLDDVIGVGLDEDTAVCITDGGCEVFGVGKVRVYTRCGGTDFATIAAGAAEKLYGANDKFAL